MSTFIYKVSHSSTIRGFNRTINVYRMRYNQPIYIGYDDRVNTASYKGDYAIACKIIAEKTAFKMSLDGYRLVNKSVRIFEV